VKKIIHKANKPNKKRVEDEIYDESEEEEPKKEQEPVPTPNDCDEENEKRDSPEERMEDENIKSEGNLHTYTGLLNENCLHDQPQSSKGDKPLDEELLTDQVPFTFTKSYS
jgi:hypothetical protein